MHYCHRGDSLLHSSPQPVPLARCTSVSRALGYVLGATCSRRNTLGSLDTAFSPPHSHIPCACCSTFPVQAKPGQNPQTSPLLVITSTNSAKSCKSHEHRLLSPIEQAPKDGTPRRTSWGNEPHPSGSAVPYIMKPAPASQLSLNAMNSSAAPVKKLATPAA